MSIAEIHGKISQTGSNLHEKLEDLLTSDVFGTFKYTEPNVVLRKFLNKSINIHNQTLNIKPIREIKYIFWPRLNACEPDLILEILDVDDKTIIILIEAKYLSGKSSSVLSEDELCIADTPNDQLAREFNDLYHYDSRSDKYLIYVTAHRNFPKKSISETNNEINKTLNVVSDKSIFWNNWFNITSILKKFNFDKELHHYKLIYDDLRDLLIRKGLYYYSGIELKTIQKINFVYMSTYEVNTESLLDIKTLQPISNFYSGSMQKQSFIELKAITLINKFYIGDNYE